MKQLRPIIWGTAIIALGIIFGGNALGFFNLNIFFHGWWTLFIIIPSLYSLITEKDKLSSLGFLAAGIILLLAAQDVFSYETAWKTILAIVIILIGFSILIRGVFKNKNNKEIEKKIKKLDNNTIDSLVAVFSGSERTYKNENFNGSNITAVFGGAELDLSRAVITKDTVIRTFCLFGGIDIKIPSDVEVKIKSGFIFGGISDERKDNDAKGKHTIYIDAAGAFGGIDIFDNKKRS